MKQIKKFGTLFIFIVAGLFSTTLPAGNQLLETYCSRLNQQAMRLEAHEEDIALALTKTATALTNFEKVLRRKDSNQHEIITLPLLNDNVSQLFELLKPTSILGTVALSTVLSKQISSHDDPEWLATKDLVTLLVEQPKLCKILTDSLHTLNVTARELFALNNPLSTWVLYNQGNPSSLHRTIAQTSGYASLASMTMFAGNLVNAALKTGISLTAPILTSFGQYIPHVNISDTVLETGYSYASTGFSYGSSVVSAINEPLIYLSIGLGIGVGIHRLYQPKRDPSVCNSQINAVMQPFLNSLQTIVKICKTLDKSSNTVLTNLANNLNLPEKIDVTSATDATLDNVFKIIHCLKTVAHLDACLALATAQVEGKITPVTIADSSRETNMRQENLEQSLTELYLAGCSDEITNPWYFANGAFRISVDDSQGAQALASRFLLNLQLSQSIGFVISPLGKPVTMPLLDTSKIMAQTQTIYLQNEKHEVLQYLFAVPGIHQTI